MGPVIDWEARTDFGGSTAVDNKLQLWLRWWEAEMDGGERRAGHALGAQGRECVACMSDVGVPKGMDRVEVEGEGVEPVAKGGGVTSAVTAGRAQWAGCPAAGTPRPIHPRGGSWNSLETAVGSNEDTHPSLPGPGRKYPHHLRGFVGNLP